MLSMIFVSARIAKYSRFIILLYKLIVVVCVCLALIFFDKVISVYKSPHCLVSIMLSFLSLIVIFVRMLLQIGLGIESGKGW